ncbi:hypothetical protein ATCC90586_004467 [Pythium insidiosum]|nr:hypothetical protein ATCC90586_004467 [Pythium insidiosum]
MHRCAVEKELEAADSIQEDPLLRRAGVSPLLTSSKEDAGFSLPELEFSPRLGPQGDAKSEVSSPLVLDEDDERWQHLSLLPQDNEAAKSPRVGRGLEATTDLLPSLLDDDEELRLRIDAPLNMDAMIPFPLQTPTQRIVGFHSFFHRPDDASRSGLVSPFKDSVRLLSPTAMDKKVLVTDNDLKLVSAEESLRFASPPARPMRLRPMRKIGIYTPEQRRERIRRFHEKRKQRVFHKRVKYDCRKRLAIACPRIKGRFVKREEYEQAMAAASAEAQDDAAWQSHSTRSEEEDEEYACDVGHGTGLTDEESAPSEVAVSPWMPEAAADATLPSSFLGDLEPNHPGASELLQIKV